MKNSDQLGTNLYKLRMAKKPPLSQSAFAAKLGIKRQTYSRYERGISEIPAWIAVKIADYYDVALESLWDKPTRKR